MTLFIKRTILMLAVLSGLSATLLAANTSEPRARDPLILFDFTALSDLERWEVEDDVVMGGRSEGHLDISESGHAVFHGVVSLENNGGFSSIQHFFDPMDVSGFTTARIRLKGDGKRYLFLIESEPDAYHYYVHEFQTGTDWQTVDIPLHEMQPVRRGDPLDLPNYQGDTLAQIRILIGNERRESFHLEIDRIWLE